jgi:hypothetical protein
LIAAINAGIGVMQEHEIDIAGIVQLARAELAHCQHHEAGAGFGIGRVGQHEVAAIVARAQEMRDGAVQAGFGEFGQSARDAVELPDAADIGERGGQCHLSLGLAQLAGETRLRPGGRDAGEDLHGLCNHRVGSALHQQPDRSGFSQGEVGEIGTVSADGCQHHASRLAGHPRLRRPNGREAFHEALRGAGIGGQRPRIWQDEAPVAGRFLHMTRWP